MRAALRGLRRRVANCSVRTAFALYAAAALLAALALSFVSTGLLGLLANATLPADPSAYSGTYVYDARSNELVPAEALSWYETPAYETLAAAEDEQAEPSADATDVVMLYVESRADRSALPVSVSDPPDASPDGEVVDLSWWSTSVSEIYDQALSFAEITAHDEARLSLSWEGGTLTLAVADDGPGFAEAALAHAAEPFWGESKGTDGHLGLGLYVARTLAERHGGRLELSNRAEGGALARARVLAPEAPQGDEKATSR